MSSLTSQVEVKEIFINGHKIKLVHLPRELTNNRWTSPKLFFKPLHILNLGIEGRWKEIVMAIQKRLAISRSPDLVYGCVGSWTGSMRRRSDRGALMIAIIFLLASCSSAHPIAFQNTSHRQIYSLNLEDLEKLQFYISRDVVAQYQDATGTKSLLLTRLTPGVATGAGPNWIKVSFREGGVDVPFVTDPNQYDGRYWIATEVEGSKDFKKIAELPEKSFLYKGVRYKLASGADAILLFDWEGWKKFVGTRKVTEGRQVGDR
jgi:hypothetical protein